MIVSGCMARPTATVSGVAVVTNDLDGGEGVDALWGDNERILTANIHRTQ
jgi:hypothetical protein